MLDEQLSSHLVNTISHFQMSLKFFSQHNPGISVNADKYLLEILYLPVGCGYELRRGNLP
jgi:hypothetical protein